VWFASARVGECVCVRACAARVCVVCARRVRARVAAGSPACVFPDLAPVRVGVLQGEVRADPEDPERAGERALRRGQHVAARTTRCNAAHPRCNAAHPRCNAAHPRCNGVRDDRAASAYRVGLLRTTYAARPRASERAAALSLHACAHRTTEGTRTEYPHGVPAREYPYESCASRAERMSDVVDAEATRAQNCASRSVATRRSALQRFKSHACNTPGARRTGTTPIRSLSARPCRRTSVRARACVRSRECVRIRVRARISCTHVRARAHTQPLVCTRGARWSPLGGRMFSLLPRRDVVFVLCFCFRAGDGALQEAGRCRRPRRARHRLVHRRQR
jgi:hypothetical protein